jgi:hypothetical protein
VIKIHRDLAQPEKHGSYVNKIRYDKSEKLKAVTNDDIFAITATIFLYMAIENLGKLIHLQFVQGNISE